MKPIRVVELFAGVGGFRLGLEGWEGNSSSSNYKEPLKTNYKVVFSNQFEPSTKSQHASDVYEERWGKKGHSSQDINEIANNSISEKDIKEIIKEHDLLVGGFPCQDYSVAGVNTKGIQGKKGVLWWNIHRILEVRRPPYVLLENVDRLLKSPTSQRGRDFSIVLSTMSDLGYNVEWKVINAADYGMPQRRRRVFIMGVHESTNMQFGDLSEWLLGKGILAEAFPGEMKGKPVEFKLTGKPKHLSETYDKGKFLNSGVIVNRKVMTFDFTPNPDSNVNYSVFKTLNDVLQSKKEIEEEFLDEFYVDGEKELKKPLKKKQKEGIELSYLELNDANEAVLETELDKWKYLKGKKAEERKASKGIFYYTEGPLKLADSKELPARTIITGEGGPGASRFKHLIELKKDKEYRRLTPTELERLNMFPDNHTKLDGVNNTKRAFFMGNALVVGIVERIGHVLYNRINGKI